MFDIQATTKIVDMCKSSSATEETHFGNSRVDCVVLRIMIQQDNCICRVTIDNQIQPIYVGLRSYDGLQSSAPVKAECGLAVDINHIPDMPTGNIIAPIECIENVNFHTLALLQNSVLEFKSRIINGSFTRGYYMRISRDTNSNHTQVLRIDCDAPTITKQTTEKTIESHTTTMTSNNDEYSSITTNAYLQTTDSLQSTTLRTKEDTIANDQIKEDDKTTYIAVSIFSSTFAIILLVVLVVTCIRNKSRQNGNSTNENTNNSSHQVKYNKHYCDLRINAPTVPGQEYDIINSNYDTIDVDRSQPSNSIICMEGEYVTGEPDDN